LFDNYIISNTTTNSSYSSLFDHQGLLFSNTLLQTWLYKRQMNRISLPSIKNGGATHHTIQYAQ